MRFSSLLLPFLPILVESLQAHDNSEWHRRQLRATPDTKDHPGIVEIPDPRSHNDTKLHLIRCRNYASAYSAAWLAPVDYVLKANYRDRVRARGRLVMQPNK